MQLGAMEVNLQALSQAFLYTLAPNPEPRKQAEAHLNAASEQPRYGITVLQLISEPGIEEQIRQAAAVNFKNHVKFRWNPTEESGLQPIQEEEKDQIKALVVRLMLSSPPRIRSQLSEALAIISGHDFPARWTSLLPELVSSLSSSTSYETINGILQTVNAIFKIFRYGYKTNDLLYNLKYCLDVFAAPLLEIFTRTAQLVKSTQDPPTLRLLFECERLCCRIFYSLNHQDIPAFFEDHIREWMGEFEYFLMYQNPALRENDPEKESVVDQVKTAICENINLYMEKYEEEFRDFLQTFATDVWNLLTGISLHPQHDRLAMSAMKFLTTVSKGVHHTLFNNKDALRQICESIAIPNARVRSEDEELFEMNPLEYIRRDMEGSDLDTRRRIACELIKGLMVHYREQVTTLIAGYIQGLVTRYSSNPLENWKDKHTGIYLVVALAQKEPTSGVVNNMDQFFASQIVPELQVTDINSQPMLKADALKFITTFRSMMPKPIVLSLIPQITRFLLSESNVVHSYAAGCIEKLLLVKDGKVPRISSSDIAPFHQQILSNLLGALKLPDSHENPYVMRCIMRVLSVADVGPSCLQYLDGLVAVLTSVCNNPTNPIFNHYIFESLAVLIRKASQTNQELITAFEAKLIPVIFEHILQKDVVEFQPYAFQILAQLIESRGRPIPATYMQIFPILLIPDLWKKNANVPAIVRLLQAFLLKAPQEIAQADQLQKVIEVFNMLISRKSTEDHAFFIANTMIESLSLEVVANFIQYIWTGMFNRLQTRPPLKFLKMLVIFMSLFVVKHGKAELVNSINRVSASQPTLFTTILEQFCIPTVSMISGSIETKLCAVGFTKLLCESPPLLGSPFGRLLNSILTLLVRPEEERVEADDDVPEMEQITSYTGVYAKLHNAGKQEDDPIKEIRDAKEFLCISLNRLCMQLPGTYPLIIHEHVEPANQLALLELCNNYRVTIV